MRDKPSKKNLKEGKIKSKWSNKKGEWSSLLEKNDLKFHIFKYIKQKLFQNILQIASIHLSHFPYIIIITQQNLYSQTHRTPMKKPQPAHTPQPLTSQPQSKPLSSKLSLPSYSYSYSHYPNNNNYSKHKNSLNLENVAEFQIRFEGDKSTEKDRGKQTQKGKDKEKSKHKQGWRERMRQRYMSRDKQKQNQKDSLREYNKYLQDTNNDKEKDDLVSIGIGIEAQESQCASIQNEMIETFLQDIRGEIQVKSNAVTVAENLVAVMEEQVSTLRRQNSILQQRLSNALQKIHQLESQLSFLKPPPIPSIPPSSSPSAPTPSIKKSFTYTTQKTIPPPSTPFNPLPLISSQIFTQFAMSYQSLIKQLTQWVSIQEQNQIQFMLNSKMRANGGELEEILYGGAAGTGGYSGNHNHRLEKEEEYSKTTYQTVQNQGKYSYMSTYNSGIVHPLQQYLHTVHLMYNEFIQQQQSALHQCINFITAMSRQSDPHLHTIPSIPSLPLSFKAPPSPKILIPNQLIKIVIKQCNSIIYNTFKELKQQNLQLVTIMEEMIEWVNRNGGDLVGGIGRNGGRGWDSMGIGKGQWRDRDGQMERERSRRMHAEDSQWDETRIGRKSRF